VNTSEAGVAEVRESGAAVRSIYAEDLRVGERHDLGSHRLTEDEIVGFATDWDPQFFHVDSEDAKESPFGGLIASGIHTLAIFQKLVVEACFRHWNIIAGKEIRELRFLRPVRPGDELTGHVVIEALTFDDRGRAEYVARGVLTNQDGKEVLSLVTVALIHSRRAAAAGS
jgi:acyl dehydratase